MEHLSNPNFVFENDLEPREASDLGEIYDTSFKTGLYRDAATNKEWANYEAMNRIIKKANELGEDHPNPHDTPVALSSAGYGPEGEGGEGLIEESERRAISFRKWRHSLKAKYRESHPEAAELFGRDLEEFAQEITRESTQEAEDTYSRGPDSTLSFIAKTAGYMSAIPYDPPSMAAFELSFGVGAAAKQGGTAVLKNMVLVSIANGLLEYPLAELAKPHAEKSGVPITTQEQLLRMGIAGGSAGILEGAGRGIARGIVKLRGRELKTDDFGYVIGSHTKEEAAEAARVRDIKARIRAAKTPEERLAAGAELLPEGNPLRDVVTSDDPDTINEGIKRLAGEGALDEDVLAATRSWNEGRKAQEEIDAQTKEFSEDEVNATLDSTQKHLEGENQPMPVAPEPLPKTKQPILADGHPERTDVDLGEKIEVDGKPVYRRTAKLDETEVQSEVYQFKSGKGVKGKNKSLEGAEHYDPDVQGNMVLFEPLRESNPEEALKRAEDSLGWARRMRTSDGSGPAYQKQVAKEKKRIATLAKRVSELKEKVKKGFKLGKKYIVADGHERWNLAARLRGEGKEVPDFEGFVFREADGWTPKDVRALAAKKNIQEGTSEPIDVASVLRERPDLVDQSLASSNPKFAQGRALARLSDEAFSAVKAGVIPERLGALIGHLADDKSSHMAIVDAFNKIKPTTDTQARQIINDLKHMPLREGNTIDTVGETMERKLLLEARAKVSDAGINLLRNRAHIFNMLKRHLGKNITDAGGMLEEAAGKGEETITKQALEVIESAASRPGRVSDSLSEQAKLVNGGKKPSKAAEDWADEVQKIMEEDGVNGLLRAREYHGREFTDIETQGKAEIDDLKADMPDVFGPEEGVAKVKVREKVKPGEKPKVDPEQAKLAEAKNEMSRATERLRARNVVTKELDDASELRRTVEAVKGCKL